MSPFDQLRTHPVTRHRIFRGLVDVVTGAALFSDVDLTLWSGSLFEWRRVYNSAHGSSTPNMGPGFRHPFSHELHLKDDHVRYVDELGLTTIFHPLDDGKRCAINGSVLERIDETRFRVYRHGGSVADLKIVDPTKPARLTGLMSEGATFCLHYDDSDTLVSIHSTDGLVVDFEYEDELLKRVELSHTSDPERRHSATYQYSSEGFLENVVGTQDHGGRYFVEEAKVTKRISSSQGLIDFTHDASGRCTAAKLGSEDLGIKLQYNPEKRITLATGADGGEWVFHYTDKEIIDYILDPYGCVTTHVLDDVGRLTQQLDAAGERIVFSFDWTGVPVKRHDRYGRATPLREGQELQGEAEELQHDGALELDWGDLCSRAKLLPSARAVFPALPKVIRQSIARGKGRRQTQRSHPDSEGDTLTEVETLADGTFRRWELDHRHEVKRYIDADGAVSAYEHDRLGAPSRIVDPLGALTSCVHNEQGKLEQLLTSKGVRSELAYDLVGRLSEVHRNGRCRDRYSYNLVGDLVEKRDGAGELLFTSEYGPGHLMNVRTLSSGDWQQLAFDSHGRLMKVASFAGELDFQFDPDGQLTGDTRDGLGVTLRRGAAGAEETVLFDRFAISSQVDDRGHRVVRDPMGGEHRFQDLGAGLLLKVLSNGLNELNQYDPSGRCLLRSTFGGPWKNRIWSRRYGYSGEGDLLVDEDSESGPYHYVYDQAHHLIETRHSDGSSEHYEYDEESNLLSSPETTFVYERHLLSKAGNTRLEHNDRGHLRLADSGEKVHWFYYDSLDQLTEVRTSDGRSYSAEFDVFGRRTKKSFHGRSRCFYWAGSKLAAEVSSSGELRIYLFAHSTSSVPFMWIDYESMSAPLESGARRYICTNHLGCPLTIVNDAGDTLWSARITPFGDPLVAEGASLHQPLRYPGWYYDDELELIHNRFRTYSPAWGRYLESNPIGLAGGSNLYTFTRPPLSKASHDGLRPGGRASIERRQERPVMEIPALSPQLATRS